MQSIDALEAEVRLMLVNPEMPEGTRVIWVQPQVYAIIVAHPRRMYDHAAVLFRKRIGTSMQLWNYLSQLEYFEGQLLNAEEKKAFLGPLYVKQYFLPCKACKRPLVSPCVYNTSSSNLCLHCWYHS